MKRNGLQNELPLFAGREGFSRLSPENHAADAPSRNGHRSTAAEGQIAYSKKLPRPALVNVVDFFCGCGGMSWGFANTRQSHFSYRVLAGVDIDRHALATYRRNVGTLAICEDIRKFAANPDRLSEVIGLGPLKNLRPLVFIGCPPCQGFSAHRKKDSRDDPRNDLAVAFAKLCKYFQPDVLVIENVPEMLKGRFGNYFQTARRMLERAGYTLNQDIVDLSHYGVPQRRMRAVIIGGLRSTIPIPVSPFQTKEPLTVRHAIGHLPPLSAGERDERDSFHRAPSHVARILSLIRQIPPDGGDRRALPAKAQLRCHSAVDRGRTPGFTDVYGRLRWDSPAVTITAKCSTPSCGRFLHPEQHRNITVREAAILQGFPQGFVFEGPFSNQYRQIGEAVPPAFARFVAWQILNYFRPRDKGAPTFRKSKPKRSAIRSTAVSLVDAFCGAGGLSLGFEAAGFETVYAFDTDPSAVTTFNKNLKPVAESADILEHGLTKRMFRAIPKNRPYVLVGGPPCQGFSQQRRGGDYDIRNNLVVRYGKILRELPRLPAAVVLENVTYLDSPRGEKILKEYLELVERAGFVPFRHDLNSAEFGVPQLRRRIVIVAILSQFADRYRSPLPLCPTRWPTVGESLYDLPPPSTNGDTPVANHYMSKEGALNKRRIMFVDMGGGRLSIPDELQLNCHRRYGGHLDVYGRLDWFSPARTITGGFDSFTRGEFAHPYFHRSITPREAARIQGFPDWFSFIGNRASVRRQIGNAVPPAMAFAVAKAIVRAVRATD
jgi:DNA (cytosine-5)-methyltransferase 1